MRLPNAEHESRPWRVHEITRDFTPEDVWALPVEGDPDDFDAFLEQMASFDPAHAHSGAARFLWDLRDRLGKLFGLGRISSPADRASERRIPGTDEASLSGRVPADLRGSAAGVRFANLPFRPLFRTSDEFAAEVSNATVHGVMHLAWVDLGDGRHGAQMAVYVKPNGSLGRAYMELIKPFRYWIVYPALMRDVEAAWKARRGPRAPPLT
jgi:hypothetical protein